MNGDSPRYVMAASCPRSGLRLRARKTFTHISESAPIAAACASADNELLHNRASFFEAHSTAANGVGVPALSSSSGPTKI
eukprot:6116506-Pyramimonas_sp.AAC.1